MASRSKSTESLLGEIKETKNTGELRKYLGDNKADMLDSLRYRLADLLSDILGLELNIDEAQELLRLAEHKALDPRGRRDAVILSCINSRMSGIDTDLRLDKLGFKPLE